MMRMIRKQRYLLILLTALALVFSLAAHPVLAAEEYDAAAEEPAVETAAEETEETETEPAPETDSTDLPEQTAGEEEASAPEGPEVEEAPEEDGTAPAPESPEAPEGPAEEASGAAEIPEAEEEPAETQEDTAVPGEAEAVPAEDGAPAGGETSEDPAPAAEEEPAQAEKGAEAFADGTYVPEFSFEGGTGRVKITCPKLVIRGGKASATLVFNSSNYTYVLVDGEKYDNENPGGDSTFTIPVNVNAATEISAETTAMSEAHLIDYTLYVRVDGQTSPAEPETPEEPEIPEGTVQVTVVKETGEEFKMFAAKASTAVLNGDMIDIVFVTENKSFDKIYIGSKDTDDAQKTDYFTGTQLEGGGFRFEFSVDRALNGTKTEVALGKPDGTWYKNMALYLVIPDLETEPEPEGPETPDDPEDPETPEEPMISEDGVLADGIYRAEVETGQPMFKVTDCVITSENGKMTAVITLSGTGYDYLYVGSAKDAYAADGEGWIPFEQDPETGKYTYTLELAAVTEPVAVASRSARYASEGKGEAAWIDRTLTFVTDSIEKISDLPEEGEQGDPSDPSEEQGTEPAEGGEGKTDGSGNSGGKDPEKEEPENTGTQDEDEIRKMEENTKKGTVADGTYVPSFGFTGGTGKVTISCPKLVVKNGKGTATLVFSSSNYTYVLVNGTKYYNENAGGKSTFTIPVNVNTTTSISAETTAMSEAHLIDYVLYIYVDGQDVSNIRPSAAGSSEDAEKAEDEDLPGAEEEEEEFGPDGKRKDSGWGEYDSVQTKDEPEAAEDTAVPTTGTETGETEPGPEQEEQTQKRGFSVWYGVGIGAAVVVLAGVGFAAMRKGKKKA